MRDTRARRPCFFFHWLQAKHRISFGRIHPSNQDEEEEVRRDIPVIGVDLSLIINEEDRQRLTRFMSKAKISSVNLYTSR
jgi:hypothetical protein